MKPFPSTPGRFQISKNGGRQPIWRRDGKELFFLAPDGVLMAMPIGDGGRFDALAVPLFQTGAVVVGRRQYGVTKDGKRFLVGVPRAGDRGTAAAPLNVVVNWLASVQK